MEKEQTDVSNQKEMVQRTKKMQNVSIAFTDNPKTGHAYSYFHTMYPNVDLDKVHYTHFFIDDLGYINFNYSVDSDKEIMRD